MQRTGNDRTRVFLGVEVFVFAVASAVHSGLLVDGHRHSDARVAEAVIAAVLLGGLVVSLIRPSVTRRAGLLAQSFALLGTMVGLFTIIVGVGPRTAPDIVFHLGLLILLVSGLTHAKRSRGHELLPARDMS